MNTGRLILVGGFLCSCTVEAPLDPIQVDPRAVAVAAFGDLESGIVLGQVKDAAISPTGRYLAVLDRDDPHLWVFDRELDTANVFGEKGEGPGELRFPLSLAFLGDSLLAVLQYGAINLFSPAGEFLNMIHLSELEIRAQAITDGCNSLFLYGTSLGESSSAEPHWLHSIDVLMDTADPVAFLPMGGRSAAKWGALEGLDGSDSEILLWHQPHTTETGWVFRCDEEVGRLLDERESAVEVRTVLLEDQSGGNVLRLPDTLFSGAVVHDGTYLVGHTVRADSGSYSEEHTQIRRWGPEGPGCIATPGRWLILDADADLVVLAIREPFPRVVLVPFSEIGGPRVLGRPCG